MEKRQAHAYNLNISNEQTENFSERSATGCTSPPSIIDFMSATAESNINSEADEVMSALSSAFARFEVEAISLLSSHDRMEDKAVRIFDENSNGDDDNLTIDEMHCNIATESLQKELSSISIECITDQKSVTDCTNPPSIIDFMSATGESMTNRNNKTLTYKDVGKFMNRDLLKLSARWSNAVVQNSSNEIYDNKARRFHLSREADEIMSALSSDCARFEVEAISLLAFHDRMENKAVRIFDENAGDDDDNLVVDEMHCNIATKSLQEELSSISIESITDQENMMIMQNSKPNHYSLSVSHVDHALQRLKHIPLFQIAGMLWYGSKGW
eukprot:CAMPEP_0195539208 /NCGR_PEP_ID=MMETSP0794_2-20130614/49935_1 /TAXON_ID=515487 /ORGANISM="Stephanopyxis turris, Strain CCMP 815" /LENGTH=327 /DNA_ID=CAMNT_0040673231 /DNA_START=155 /DNA_END=1135 /DNA_ORIENTATION=+